MSEFFKIPGMAWFALLGAIPVVIHLLNRHQFRRVKWAAMEFLLRAFQKTRRRLQFENLLLLIVRVLVLSLLALGLAQPILKSAPMSWMRTSDTHYVLLLDVSYSMGQRMPSGETAWDKARKSALSLLDQVRPDEGDRISVVLLSDHPTGLIEEPSVQVERARKLIGELPLSDYGSGATGGIEIALEILRASKNQQKKVFLFTDGQERFWSTETGGERLKTRLNELAALAPVTVLDVGPERAPSNLGVLALDSKRALVGLGETAVFTAQVRNYGPTGAAGTNAHLYVDGQERSSQPVAADPGKESPLTFLVDFTEPGPHAVRVELDPDSLGGDNTRVLGLDVTAHIRALLVDGEPAADPVEDEAIFVRLALDPGGEGGSRNSLFAVETISDISFGQTDLYPYDLVVLANLATLYEEQVQRLEEFVSAGGGLMIFPGDRVDRGVYNDRLYRDGNGLLPGRLQAPLGDPNWRSSGLQQEVRFNPDADFKHPVMAPFDKFRQHLESLFTFQYCPIEADVARPDIRVPLRFADGANNPVLTEKSFGRGKVLLCATSADSEWNVWPTSQAFVPLIDICARHLSAPAHGFRNVAVGDPLELTLKANAFARTFTLQTPGQGVTTLTPREIPGRGFLLSYPCAERAGVYTLERAPDAGSPAGSPPVPFAYFGVNPDPREGDLSRISQDDLQRRFPQFKFSWVGTLSGDAPPDFQPPSSNLYRGFLFAVLGLLGLEMFLAQRFGRRH